MISLRLLLKCILAPFRFKHRREQAKVSGAFMAEKIFGTVPHR